MNRITLAPILRGAYIHTLGTPLILLSTPREHPQLPALKLPAPESPLPKAPAPYTPDQRRSEQALAHHIKSALETLKTPAGALPAALCIPGVGSFFAGTDYSAARQAQTAAEAAAQPAAEHSPAAKHSAEDTAAAPEHIQPADIAQNIYLAAPPEYSLKTAGSPVQGRIALVTGGAQGFGAELARGLANNGAFVVIADINLQGAQKFAAELNTPGPRRALALPVDVSSEQSLAEMSRSIVAEVGGLDLLISNAGVLRSGSVLELPSEDFDFVTKINYNAFFLITRNCSPIMIRQNAAAPALTADIIQINSKSGLEGSNRNGAYAGGKFGGIGLVQSFAMELIEYGIKVNAVCPGNFFQGPLWSHPQNGLFVQYLNNGKVPGAQNIEDVRKFYESKVPMRRGCEGPDVLKAVLYCVDQQYETGQALPVTGGQVMMR